MANKPANQKYTIAQIAAHLNATALGDATLIVDSVAEPKSATKTQLALALDKSYATDLQNSHAQAAIVWADADWQNMGLKAAIIAPSRYTLSGVSVLFETPPDTDGIHPSAVIDESAQIGKNPQIGAFCVIGRGAVIGDNLRMLSHASIAENATIGDNALIYNGARIGARVQIGARVIIQAGAVIGSDGFSFVTPKPSRVEKVKKDGQGAVDEANHFVRINSLGAVVLGDDVEIGANCAIDRGTVANTQIGDRTKLDNLVMIAHNVQIGRDCLICGQVAIAGSTRLGDRVILGGQVGVADHITVGSDVIAAGASSLSSNVPSGRVMMGNPATKMDIQVAAYRGFRRLPRLAERLAKIEKKLTIND